MDLLDRRLYKNGLKIVRKPVFLIFLINYELSIFFDDKIVNFSKFAQLIYTGNHIFLLEKILTV